MMLTFNGPAQTKNKVYSSTLKSFSGYKSAKKDLNVGKGLNGLDGLLVIGHHAGK